MGSEGGGSRGTSTMSWWQHQCDGWWSKGLTAASSECAYPALGMPVRVFEALMGRQPLDGGRDVLPITSAGRTYLLAYSSCTSSKQLKGLEFKAWVADSGARPGDSIALKRQGQQVVVKCVPAPPACSEEQPTAIRSPVAQQVARSLSRDGPAEDEQQEEQHERANECQQPQPQQQQSDQLSFAPKRTPSIAAALANSSPLDRSVRGAVELPKTVGGQPLWKLEFRRLGLNARLRVSERRQAAVAADLILSWRRALNDLHAGPVTNAHLNVPEAGYKDDRLLVQQLRQIANPSQMKLFLQAVLPRDQPGARERGEQQAVEGFADVPLEVKQEEGEEEEEEEAAAEEEQEGDAEAGEEEDGVDAEADNQPGLECELPFEPQPCTSITTGLQMPCGAEGRALGVLPNGLRWHVWISWMKGKACLSLGSKHTAAVAADVVYMWRQTCGNTLQKALAVRALNVPAAGYDTDEVLLDQLREIGSAKQMKQFLQAVLPLSALPTQQQQQHATAGECEAVGTAAAAADTSMAEAPLIGSRKRKQREPDREINHVLQRSHVQLLPANEVVGRQAQLPQQQQQQQQQEKTKPEHASRRYFWGPKLRPSDASCAPLLVLEVKQADGTSALYLPKPQLRIECQGSAIIPPERMVRHLELQCLKQEALGPPALLPATAFECGLLRDQGCMHPKGSRTCFLLLSAVGQALTGPYALGAEAQAGIQELLRSGTQALLPFDGPHDTPAQLPAPPMLQQGRREAVPSANAMAPAAAAAGTGSERLAHLRELAVHEQANGVGVPPISPQGRQGAQQPRQEQPVAAPALDPQQSSPGARSAGFSGAAQAEPGRLEACASKFAKRMEQKALAAFEETADDMSSSSMRLCLRRLLLVPANKGNETLREVEREWQTYPPALQQNLHETAFLVAVDRSWAHLEEGLRLELQTAG